MLWPVLPFCIVRPNARNRGSALRASAILDAILLHVMPGTAHEQFLALWAIRVRPIAVNISFIHIPQAHFERDLPGMIKRLRWSARLVLQLEVRMKCGEMQRHVRPKMGQNPLGKLPRFVGIIKLVISNHTFVSFFSHSSVSSTG